MQYRRRYREYQAVTEKKKHVKYNHRDIVVIYLRLCKVNFFYMKRKIVIESLISVAFVQLTECNIKCSFYIEKT